MTSQVENSDPLQANWKAVASFALATLLVASEVSLAGLTLPLIRTEFEVLAAAASWVVLLFALPLAALAIPAGRWVDTSDIRAVFGWSLALFCGASILAALAPDFRVLLAARLVQGIAAAIYVAIYMPVVAAAIPEVHRGKAMGAIATVMMVGSLAIAPVAGLVVEWHGWRVAYGAKVPLLMVLLVLGYRTIPRTPHRPHDRQRNGIALLAETLLLGVGLAAGLLALELSRGYLQIVAICLIVSLLSLALWSRLKASREVVGLLGQSSMAASILLLLSMASVVGLFAITLPFYLTENLNLGMDMFGWGLLFYVGAAAITSPVSGYLSDQYGASRVSAVGGVATALALLILIALAPGDGVWSLSWRLAILGAANGICNPATMTAILAGASAGRSGAAGGLANTARAIGQTIGPALCAYLWSLSGGGAFALAATGMVLASIICLASIFVLVSLPPRGRNMPNPASR